MFLITFMVTGSIIVPWIFVKRSKYLKWFMFYKTINHRELSSRRSNVEERTINRFSLLREQVSERRPIWRPVIRVMRFRNSRMIMVAELE